MIVSTCFACYLYSSECSPYFGPWKFIVQFLRGGVKLLEEKYEANLELSQGLRGCKTKNLPWGSTDIFWNYKLFILTARKLIAQKAMRTSYKGSRGLSSTVTPRGLKKYNRIPTNAIGTKVHVKHVVHPK